MNGLLRFACERDRRIGVFPPPLGRRIGQPDSRHRIWTALVLALALNSVGNALAQSQTPPKSLYLVAVGITNANGQPLLKATAKDALDIAKWARSQKDKLYGRVQVTTL